MPYGEQSAQLARCAIRNHGELKEVAFVSGNKDYVLVFADGTELTPYNVQHEYSAYTGYGEIAQQLGGTAPYSLLAFGYQGTGPGCFAKFLQTAGFDVSEKDMQEISPPVRLRPDGSQVHDGEEESAPVEEVVAAVEVAAPAEEAALEVVEPAPTPVEEPAPAEPVTPIAPAADWYADPVGHHTHRYWDGTAWTDHVADNGIASLDPVAAAAPAAAAAVALQAAVKSGPVEFDENGRVTKVTFPVNPIWPREVAGQCNYMTRSVDTLLEATEVLRQLPDVPGLHYYVCETPDGNLCRDINGYYTEAPLKTKDLRLAVQGMATAPVESESLTVFGDPVKNQSSVAAIKHNGQYAKFILLMECGRCGYKSPVETEGGDLERECYCCGTINTGFRGMVSVVLGDGVMVEI